MGSILSRLQPFGNISFNFAILISGYPSQVECHKYLMQPNSIKKVSSLHIYGIKDTLVNNDRSLQLAATFKNPIIVSHPGGHFTPTSWPNTNIKQFLLEQQKTLSNRQTMTIRTSSEQFRSLATFEEKIEATISFHQKRRKICIIPIGLSSPIDEQNMETVIKNLDSYVFDDVMLLVWCKRRTFYSRESKNDGDKNVMPSFFRYWIQLYLKKPDDVLSMHLSTIPKYGSWGDLVGIYQCAGQTTSEFPTELTLLENLKEACVKMIGNQLKHDHQIVLGESSEYSSVEQEHILIRSQDWISNCADEAPRIPANYKKSTTSKDLSFVFIFTLNYLSICI